MKKKDLKEKPLTLSTLVEYLEGPYFTRLKEVLATKDEFNAFRFENHKNFDFLFKQYERLEQEYTVINKQLKTLDPILEKMETLS